MCVRVAKKAKDALEELHCPVSCAEKGRQNHYYHQDASGFLGLLPTCLEPWLLLQKNGPSELIVLLKSTGSSEHFDIKIKIVSTADSEKRLFYGL